MIDFNFEHIRPITWNEIWTNWRISEEEHWRPHYQARGFKTWDEWRGRYKADYPDVKLEEKKWNLYAIINPASDILKMHIGPFKGWQKYYPGRNQSTFKEVVEFGLSEQNEKVKYFINNQPKSIRLIGVKFRDQIMIIEGTHRCTAMSVLATKNIKITSSVEIAITEFSEAESKLFENIFHKVPFQNNDNL